MLVRINIFRIVKDHFGTLRSLNQKNTKKIYWADALLFIGLPLVIAIILSLLDLNLKNQLGNLIAAVSIFGGFLLNLLAIIYSQMTTIKEHNSKEKDRLKAELRSTFIKEIHVNISFGIVASITLVVTLLLNTIGFSKALQDMYILTAIQALNYFLLTLFFLTLLMIVKRVYILLDKG